VACFTKPASVGLGLRQTQAGSVPEVKDVTLRGARERLVQLYDARDKPDEEAKWRKELEKTKEKP
jgi:hypothetical protein